MPQHLVELKQLVGPWVSSEDLLSLDETIRLQSMGAAASREPASTVELGFENRLTPRFANFIRALEAASGAQVYAWTPLSSVCGVLRPVPLGTIHFDFPYTVNSDGIIEFVTVDLKDSLVLDFFEDASGQKRLEVTTSGQRWGPIRPDVGSS